ncbi:hypothetical protein ACP275_07G070700 [Erythranthe tilingii]
MKNTTASPILVLFALLFITTFVHSSSEIYGVEAMKVQPSITRATITKRCGNTPCRKDADCINAHCGISRCLAFVVRGERTKSCVTIANTR